MKTFKDFVAKRKYISVQYDEESQKKLREWAKQNGFDLSAKYDGSKQDPKDFDFHTTIFYSANEVNLINKKIKHEPTEVSIIGIKFLGENKDIPVLTVSVSGGIKDLRQHYENLGLEDQWPDFIPHISVSYAKKPVDIEKIELPTFKPKYDKVIITDVKG